MLFDDVYRTKMPLSGLHLAYNMEYPGLQLSAAYAPIPIIFAMPLSPILAVETPAAWNVACIFVYFKLNEKMRKTAVSAVSFCRRLTDEVSWHDRK